MHTPMVRDGQTVEVTYRGLAEDVAKTTVILLLTNRL